MKREASVEVPEQALSEASAGHRTTARRAKRDGERPKRKSEFKCEREKHERDSSLLLRGAAVSLPVD